MISDVKYFELEGYTKARAAGLEETRGFFLIVKSGRAFEVRGLNDLSDSLHRGSLSFDQDESGEIITISCDFSEFMNEQESFDYIHSGSRTKALRENILVLFNEQKIKTSYEVGSFEYTLLSELNKEWFESDVLEVKQPNEDLLEQVEDSLEAVEQAKSLSLAEALKTIADKAENFMMDVSPKNLLVRKLDEEVVQDIHASNHLNIVCVYKRCEPYSTYVTTSKKGVEYLIKVINSALDSSYIPFTSLIVITGTSERPLTNVESTYVMSMVRSVYGMQSTPYGSFVSSKRTEELISWLSEQINQLR